MIDLKIRTLLSSTDVGKRIGMSAVMVNKVLKEKGVMYRRGRPSKKLKGVIKPYWWIADEWIAFGVNQRNHHGGSTPKFFSDKVDELTLEIEQGGLS